MRKLAWFAIGFGVGAALCVAGFRHLWAVALGVVCVLAVFAWIFVRGWSQAAIVVLGFAVGCLWTVGFDVWIQAPKRAMDGQTVEMTVRLCDELKPTTHGSGGYVDTSIDGRRCHLLLYLDDIPEARAGDCLTLTATLVVPDDAAMELYHRANGVDFIAYARPLEQVVPDRGTLPLRLRRELKAKIRALFDEEAEPLVMAILTGDRSGLSETQMNALSVSGIAHTVAISGMHVSILLGLIMLLCGRRRWLSAIFGIPVIVVFTLMVGAMPSVVRAAVMQIIVLLAPLLCREDDPLTSLGAAGLCLLMHNPWTVANLSFQLSFASMAGILLLSGRICRRLTAISWIGKAAKQRMLHPLVRYVISTIGSTCGAYVFTVPILAWSFGVVSLLGIVTNLLTVWAVSLVFQAALAACALGFVWLWPAKLLAALIAYPVRYILVVAAGITRLGISAVYTDNVYILFWLVFSYALGIFCIFPNGKRLWPACVCLSVLALCLSVWLGYLDGRASQFRFTMLDVGQGQCLLFQTDDVTVMYDCGGDGEARAGERAARFALSQNVPRVDVLVVSHYDIDHAGGVCQLMERLRVEQLYLPDIPCETSMRADIERSAAAHGTQLRYVTQNEELFFSDARLCVYAPVITETENDASLALLYSQGDYDIFVTGDMSASAERALLMQEPLSEVEVLVAGHHGSPDSTCATLLEHLQPKTVLISVGENNHYGHPSPETLARIALTGAQVYRTDACGTITIRR